MTFSHLFFVFSLHVITSASDIDWCYEIQKASNQVCKAPREWKDIKTTYCGGEKQSPINIVTHNAHFKPELTKFSFEGYDKANTYKLQNNGHSAELELLESIEITGGGLPTAYTATQLHFHWGNEDMAGSEHSIDGERYPIELHIVHTKKSGSHKSESSGGTTGGTTESGNIAVLGFFLEEDTADNEKYTGIINGLSKIPEKGDSTNVSDVKLQELIPEENDLKLYYRYEGSLTTPLCNETVTWTVFPKTIKLGKGQIEAFYQKLKYPNGELMAENFRPTQKQGTRNVYTSGVDAILPHSRHLLISLIAFYAVSAS